jgi:hypothetical protein
MYIKIESIQIENIKNKIEDKFNNAIIIYANLRSQ